MKISIVKIEQEELLADVNKLASTKIIGGGGLEGSTSSFTIFGSNIALGSSRVFALTNTSAEADTSSSASSGNVNGIGFSLSSSSSAAISG